MEWRLKADKAGMYHLAGEYQDMPRIEEVYFHFSKRQCWMEYYSKLDGHYVMVRLGLCGRKGYLGFSDLTADLEMRVINLDFEEMMERGLLGEIKVREEPADSKRIGRRCIFWLIGCAVACLLVWLIYNRF